ncbi:MAG: DUF2802 domain-containing protein [Rhodocyclaceae bacterium]|nr:DUF2802 domain-containing protein [Rhodocyclaceae bacterium]
MDLTKLDWRVALLTLVVLLALYLAYALLRLGRMQRSRGNSTAARDLPESTDKALFSAPSGHPAPRAAEVVQVADTVGFATRQFMRGVEAELDQVRTELAALKEEIAHLKAARQTSPHYAEAMSLASDGADVQTMADRCGISVAEAELVRALTRREEHKNTKGLP